ncbi:MAG: F0F1 ATP synthase subunit delta [Candidatus Saccharimonadales bacterium]
MSQKFSRRTIARTVAAGLLDRPVDRKLWLQRTAAYLAANNRQSEAELLAQDIALELFVQGGQLSVDVVSARGLSEGVKAELVKMFKAATGASRVSLAERRDPSLIGGLIARTPSAVADLSVRTKLKQLATIK